MAFTLHFQRSTQGLRTGEGIGWAARVSSLACPGILRPTPPKPPYQSWVLSGSHHPLGLQVTEFSALKLGSAVGPQLPLQLGGQLGGTEREWQLQDNECHIYTYYIPSILTCNMA